LRYRSARGDHGGSRKKIGSLETQSPWRRRFSSRGPQVDDARFALLQADAHILCAST
jgi:hypothetical protein